MRIQGSILGRLGFAAACALAAATFVESAIAEQPQGKVVNPASLAKDALDKSKAVAEKADAHVDAATKEADKALSDAEDELAAEEEEMEDELDEAEEEMADPTKR